MLNGNNNEYIVLFGNERHHPELHESACRHRYQRIKDARRYADGFLNAYIFKLHWTKDGDEPEFSEVY